METIEKVLKIISIFNIYKIIEAIFFSFIPSIRNHGFAHFCGNELYLIGGFIKKRQPNQLMERFKINKGK